ncbi:ABC transporter transmembrane domain-containing protein [Tessaracoccus oleiagri]|uniref:ABC-type multidrug transport system, ATPase and permease component n=1 Tax=Tessaracoccus oleiagri TaxID=686624 RepID=A0A1G9H322_9ACTN|nr:ABC transporter ATP-binding protein [Tessaracoccus oleiagri]SDL07214.1 ABC-type multidrug transport system, ATPase and permease component [Tessaracoccus oleiagri]
MHVQPRGRYDFPPAIPADSRPDVRSPSRFLFWLIRSYGWVMPAMTLGAASWMIPAARTPWLLGRAIDAGVARADVPAALGWVGLLLLVIAIGVGGGILFHTFAVRMWLLGKYGLQRRVSHRAVRLGHVLNRRVPTGEVISVSSSDTDQFGATLESFGHAIAAAFSFVLASVLMLSTSPTLGAVVLVATPLLLLGSMPVLRPLTRAQAAERSESSSLTSLATDIATGLRILRGVGGERTFAGNYERQPQKVRALGIRLGTWQAVVEAISILLSGLLLVALVYLGSLRLLEGTLSIGELISFFGYAVFLTSPMQTFFEFAQKWVQGLVAAQKTIALLGTDVPWADGGRPLGPAPVLHDEASGVTVRPGRMLGIVSADPDDSAQLADRLGRYLPQESPDPVDDAELTGRRRKLARRERLEERARRAREDAERAGRPWGVTADGVDYSKLDMASLRRTIVVSHTDAMLFSGTLQTAVDPWGTHARQDAERALIVASAEDIYESLPGGWQGRIDEKGRGLSGGQRQRLVLARALLRDPEVLVLVEPTSAVDAHTEARIAARLADHRQGRTTVVVTASPLLLRRCDEIALLVDGREIARGTHDQLHDHPEFRRIVARGMEDSDA